MQGSVGRDNEDFVNNDKKSWTFINSVDFSYALKSMTNNMYY